MTNENVYYDDLENDEFFEDYYEDYDDDESYDFEDDDDYDEDYDDDEGYDFEDYDDDDGEDSGEFFGRRRRRRRRRRRYRRPRVARGRGYGRRVSKRYRGRGRIKTPAGTARVNLPTNLATNQDLKRALAAVSKDVKKNAKAIKVTDGNLKSLGSEVSKAKLQTNKVKKSIDALKQQQLFTTLLGQSQIQGMQLSEVDSNGNVIANTTKNYQVNNVQADNSNAMLMAMMAGDTGGGKDNNSLMPLMLMQSLDCNNSNSNDNTMLVLAMMMMNKKNS